MTTKKVRVLAADDSLLMHKLIQNTLKGSPYELVAAARTGREAVERYRELRPDVVLLDIVMPDQNGMDALKAILAADPAARVVMLSSLGTEEAVAECMRAGARQFVQKPFESGTLLDVLRLASQDDGD